MWLSKWRRRRWSTPAPQEIASLSTPQRWDLIEGLIATGAPCHVLSLVQNDTQPQRLEWANITMRCARSISDGHGTGSARWLAQNGIPWSGTDASDLTSDLLRANKAIRRAIVSAQPPRNHPPAFQAMLASVALHHGNNSLARQLDWKAVWTESPVLMIRASAHAAVEHPPFPVPRQVQQWITWWTHAPSPALPRVLEVVCAPGTNHAGFSPPLVAALMPHMSADQAREAALVLDNDRGGTGIAHQLVRDENHALVEALRARSVQALLESTISTTTAPTRSALKM